MKFLRPLTAATMALVFAAPLSHRALADQATPKIAPNAAPTNMKKPLQVFILLGQSNMVGMGDVNGRGYRWGSQFVDQTLSIYSGAYDPKANYDKMKPIETQTLGTGSKQKFKKPEGKVPVTYVLRGLIKPKASGIYEIHTGYGASSVNITKVDGKEIYHREPGRGKTPKSTPFKLTAGKKVPFTVIFLTERARHLGWIIRQDVPGTLTTAVKYQNMFPYLTNSSGGWKKCDSVYYYDARTHHGSPLSPASNNGGHSFGPELGFGFVLGTVDHAPILLLKSCIGNRSLGWDLLPPGSPEESYNGTTDAGYHESPSSWKTGDKPADLMKDYKAQKGWWAGRQYDMDIANAKAALKKLAKIDPQYKGQGYKIAGFLFWQGDKDSFSATQSHFYEKNLVKFIDSVRKDFNAPKAPFVVASIGFYGKDMKETNPNMYEIWKAQMAVSDAKKYPQFAGNVASVNTRPFWLPSSESPNPRQSYHYWHNAITYVHVGVHCGWAMATLLGDTSN